MIELRELPAGNGTVVQLADGTLSVRSTKKVVSRHNYAAVEPERDIDVLTVMQIAVSRVLASMRCFQFNLQSRLENGTNEGSELFFDKIFFDRKQGR